MNRAQAVRNALHEMQLEGFEFTADELALWEKVAAGKVSLDELWDTFIRFGDEMRTRYPELYDEEKHILAKRKRGLR